MALPLSGPISINAINVEFARSSTATTAMSQLYRNAGIVTSNNTNVPTSGVISLSQFYGAVNIVYPGKAIFGYGYTSAAVSITNLVSNTGAVSADVTGVGTARWGIAAAGYGGDKAIFGYGSTGTLGQVFVPTVSITNLVSNTGVVSADVTGVGTARYSLSATGYGGDKAIFGYGVSGSTGGRFSMTNLVSNTGVVSADVTGVGTARSSVGAAGYGGDKAIFGYGTAVSQAFSLTNLVSNTGAVSADVTGVGSPKTSVAAGYGGDKAIFGYGSDLGSDVYTTNLVSNTGVVSANVTGVGTFRVAYAAATYDKGNKAIFGYGAALVDNSIVSLSITNLISDTGVVSADVTGVGTARYSLAAAGFGA